MMKVLIAALISTTLASDNKVTPVQKVIELMENMVEKGKKEMGDEQIQFATFKTFCDNTVAAKQQAIAEATEMIEVLTADIEKYEAEAADAGKTVASLDADISTWEGDTVAAEKVRAIEKNRLHCDPQGLLRIHRSFGDGNCYSPEDVRRCSAGCGCINTIVDRKAFPC